MHLSVNYYSAEVEPSKGEQLSARGSSSASPLNTAACKSAHYSVRKLPAVFARRQMTMMTVCAPISTHLQTGRRQGAMLARLVYAL